jgi:hypothetical protein
MGAIRFGEAVFETSFENEGSRLKSGSTVRGL